MPGRCPPGGGQGDAGTGIESWNQSFKFFKPITLKEMVKLRTEANYYMAY